MTTKNLIKAKAENDYDNIKKLYNVTKNEQAPVFNKLLTAQSIMVFGIKKKDKKIYERGYNEVRKYQLEILSADFDNFQLFIIKNNTENSYHNDNAYLQVCNRMKEDREFMELEYTYLMKINYFD